jgi:ribosomal protein S18 acetylase RimI-like enzyme
MTTRVPPGAPLRRLGPPERELYERGTATLVASWERIAQGASGAAVLRAPGLAAAVFPAGPERDVYNNAVLERDLGSAERDAALAAMEDAYEAAGVSQFAAWAHASDCALIEALERRGYRLAETTRAMGLALDDLHESGEAELAEATWPEYLRHLQAFGLPAGLLAHVDPTAFRVLAARLHGEIVTTGLALDHRGDCGIYNVSTLEPARRRGLGTALTAGLLHAAARRGCTTASLQATPMAERVYAAAGFRDLGRILEYVRGSFPN